MGNRIRETGNGMQLYPVSRILFPDLLKVRPPIAWRIAVVERNV